MRILILLISALSVMGCESIRESYRPDPLIKDNKLKIKDVSYITESGDRFK